MVWAGQVEATWGSPRHTWLSWRIWTWGAEHRCSLGFPGESHFPNSLVGTRTEWLPHLYWQRQGGGRQSFSYLFCIPYPSLVSWCKCLFSLSYYLFLPTFCPLWWPHWSPFPSHLILHLHYPFQIHPAQLSTPWQTTFAGSLPTFHGIFEEEVIHIEDSCAVRLLGA